MLERIKMNFTESIQTQISAAETLPNVLSKASAMLVQSLLNGHKVLCCASGPSVANAQYFSSYLMNSYQTERPSLPALALTADLTLLTAVQCSQTPNEIYAKQVRALGQSGDILLAISTGGNNQQVIKAIEAALTRDMTIIGLTGCDGGELAGLITPMDIEIRIPSYVEPRIHEMHLFVLGCLCDLIDSTLFPHQE